MDISFSCDNYFDHVQPRNIKNDHDNSSDDSVACFEAHNNSQMIWIGKNHRNHDSDKR